MARQAHASVPSDAQASRMELFLEDMSKVLGRKLDVMLDPGAGGTGEYAFTDGKKGVVVMDPWRLEWANSVRAWLQTKGLFYHEVMHTQTDPVTDYNHPLIKPVHRTVNALSDQTGEVRFVNLYPGARGYFAMNVFEILLKRAPNERTHALVYGRRSFVPARLLQMTRKLMAAKYGEQKTTEVEALIDEYHQKATEGAPMPAYADIATRLEAILNGELEGMSEQIAHGRMTPEGKRSDENEAQPEPEPAEQKEDEQEESGESEPGADEGEDEKDEGDEEGGAGKGESEDEPEESSGDEGAGEPGDEDSGGDSGEEQAPEAGSGSAEPKKNEPELPSEIRDAIRDIAREARDEARDEQMATAQREADELHLGIDLQDVAAKAGAELAAMLKRVQLKVAAGYEGGHKSGRLDLNRVRQEQSRGYGAPSSEVFRQWVPDRRMETKMSVALLIDQSGSMSGDPLDKANQAAAAIGMACEKSSPGMNRLMVRYFAESDIMTKRPNETFDLNRSLSSAVRGGTRPLMSIEQAMRWLEAEQGIKVMLILTDGEWQGWNSWNGHDITTRAERAGVRVQVFLIDETVGPNVGLPLRCIGLGELAERVFEVVNEAMRARMRRVLL